MKSKIKKQSSFKDIELLVVTLILFLLPGRITPLQAENYALKFTANSNNVQIGKADQALDAWTVEMWVKKTQSANHSTILAGDRFKLNLETWGHNRKVGYTLIGQPAPDKAFNYTLPAQSWTHIAYVYSEGKISLFINGVLKETQNNTVQLPLKSLGLASESFVGDIDEVRIWDIARSADELKTYMNKSVNPVGQNHLLAYWYFDDQAATVTDISSAGLVGVINGATYTKNTNGNFKTELPDMKTKEISCFHNNEYLVRPGSQNQEILGVKIVTEGILAPISLTKLKIDFSQSTNVKDITKCTLYQTGQLNQFSTEAVLATANTVENTINFSTSLKLQPGVNYLWIGVDVKNDAANNNHLDAKLLSAEIGGKTYAEGNFNPKGNRLISTEISPVAQGNALSLIPKPMNMTTNNTTFTLNNETRILATAGLEKEADYLAEILRNSTGYTFQVSKLSGNPQTETNVIILNLSTTLDATIGKEGYTLNSNGEKIIIEAKEAAGVFWGIQTLRQLLPPQIESKNVLANQTWVFPGVAIKDNPRFVYRGVMLDVSRHFFPISTIKRTLDLMALYKLNVFHWHLTDDQGWRIEIKKYPKLTEVGAWRTCDGIKTGGFYTQEEIKEVVAYASSLHIDIVPEIDLPGHMLAALASYPNLGCTSGPGTYDVTCNRGGIYADILCGGKQETYTFLENVLTEVIALFPGKFVHIGGDEAAKGKWNTCSDCQAKIAELGITGANQTEKSNKLQKYMTDYFVKFLADRGKQLLGWDEITHGGIPEGAAIQLWNESNQETKKAVVQAIKNGQDVIMSSYHKLYLAQRQSNSPDEPAGPQQINTLDEFYTYEPVYDNIPADKVKHVLGAEGCLWTEWVETESHVDYMLSPRMQALAEMTWTPKADKNYNSFLERLNPHFERWNVMGYNFRWNVKPQTISRNIKTCDGELQLSATQEGVSYFWNDKNNSKTKSITVTESGIYKCYVDYYGEIVEETYVVDFTGEASLGKLKKKNNTTDQTLTLSVENANDEVAYRWYKNDELLRLGNEITLPEATNLDQYYIDANSLTNGISSLNLNTPNAYVLLDKGSFMDNAKLFSFETWIKVNEWKTWGAIFKRRENSNDERVMMELGNNGVVYCFVANGGNTYGKAPARTLNVGTWTHIACVYDGTKTGNENRLKLYINGEEVKLEYTGNIPASLPKLNADFRMGRGEKQLTPNINIADVRVWKTARTAENIKFNMQGLREGKMADLEFYYPFAMLANDHSELVNPFNNSQKATVNGLSAGYVSIDTAPTSVLSCSSKKSKVTELLTGLLNIEADNTSLQVVPNPNTGSFTVTLTDLSATNGTLKVVTLQGKTIYSEFLNELPVNKRITLKKISKGVYFVLFATNDNKSYVAKMLVE